MLAPRTLPMTCCDKRGGIAKVGMARFPCRKGSMRQREARAESQSYRSTTSDPVVVARNIIAISLRSRNILKE